MTAHVATGLDGVTDEVRLQAWLDRLLFDLCEADGSDLHIQAGSVPRLRIHGDLIKAPREMAPSSKQTMALAKLIAPSDLIDDMEGGDEVDFAYHARDIGRFRVHIYSQLGSPALSFRRVLPHVPDFEGLGLPPIVRSLADEPRGLVLVTGPTGSGKTTTLAAMIDHINHNRDCHVVTIEDPIEYLHRADRAEISQREVGLDTKDFATAMRAAMRQDPDVILVGEMRDLETVSAAISAAETGHLVFSTLHTTDAAETISRIIDFFPPYQQEQVRSSVAGCLRGTIGQRLVRTPFGSGRVPAVEAMVVTGRVQQCILNPQRTGEIRQIIEEGDYYGMLTFDQSLVELCARGAIDLEAAMQAASSPHDLKLRLHQRGITG